MPHENYRQNAQLQQPVIVQQEESAYMMPTAAASYAIAELKAYENTLRAALANQTMNNVSLLVANEARCLQGAPGGAEQYRQIVQAYTDAALAAVLRGER